jgi:hypothetical protein
MPLDLVANTAAIVQALQDYNTTTAAAYVSQSVGSSQIDSRNIMAGDPEIEAVRADRIPGIYVRVSSWESQPGAIGKTGVGAGRVHSRAKVIFDIIALVRKDGGATAYSTLLKDVSNLARNVEGVFRHEYTLSGTAMFCQPVRTNFIVTMDDQNRWVRGFVMELEASYNYR